MKLKILIAPFSFVLAIIIFIAFVWPEIGLLGVNRSNIQADQNLLDEMNIKKQNIEKLKNDLDQETNKTTITYNFMPQERKDEKIIDGLNFLAKDSSVDLVMLSVEKDTAPAAPAPATITAGEAMQATMGNGVTGSAVPAAVSRDVDYLTSKIQVSGTYENLKLFLSQIYKMEMFNKIADLTITHFQNQAAQGAKTPSGSSPTLALNTSLNFGYLQPVSTDHTTSAPILLQSSFDFNPFVNLEKLINRKIPTLDEGSKGKSNPFLP